MHPFQRTLAGLALAFATTVQAEEQRFEVPLSRPGEPAVLRVDLINGEIHVIGEDRDDVLLEIASAPSGRTIVTPSGPKQVPGGALQMEIEEYDNVVDIDSDARTSGIVVRARVPRETSLELETVHDGVIMVENVTGEFEFDNVHGPITGTGLRGPVVAETVHGSVIIELLETPANRPMAIETLHGDIELSLPASHAAELHIISASDEVFTDFEVELMPVQPSVGRDDGGRFVVEMDREIVAAINGGGPQITLETRYGDVSVLKSNR